MKITSFMTIAAGVFFYAKKTRRFLYLLRNDLRQNYAWSIPGGKIEKDETLYEGLKRECIEEIQFFSDNLKLIPIQKFEDRNFVYHTFFCEITEEFIPILNDEHIGYAWVGEFQYPKPLHPGLFSTINIDSVQEKLHKLTQKKSGSKSRSQSN